MLCSNLISFLWKLWPVACRNTHNNDRFSLPCTQIYQHTSILNPFPTNLLPIKPAPKPLSPSLMFCYQALRSENQPLPPLHVASENPMQSWNISCPIYYLVLNTLYTLREFFKPFSLALQQDKFDFIFAAGRSLVIYLVYVDDNLFTLLKMMAFKVMIHYP